MLLSKPCAYRDRHSAGYRSGPVPQPFGSAVPPAFSADIRTEAELYGILGFAREGSLPVFVLGGGSNLVVPDSGFDGLVVHIALDGAIVPSREGEHVTYTVPAGVEWDGFVLSGRARGVSGIECLAGSLELSAGTPVQNVGAYGQEVAETIASVRALDLENNRFVETLECRVRLRLSVQHLQHNASWTPHRNGCHVSIRSWP